MSAIARFPWVRACVQARSSDLAGLPLIAVRTLPDGTRERLPPTDPSYRTIALLQRPNSQTSGRKFRRQLSADLDLTGNAFVWVEYDAIGPAALFRMHPADVEPIANDLGIVTGYRVTGETGQKVVEYSQILHISDISWRDDRRQVLGESRIRTLHHDLLAVMASKTLLTQQARRGRPEFLATPKGNTGVGEDGANRLMEAFEKRSREGKGFLFVGRELNVTPLNLTARDMEYQELESRACQATLAVFDVPLVRVHKEGANYGTAKQQMRNYWESLQHGAASMFDDAFSLLTGDPMVRIEHDFTAVEALQLSRTERLDRAAVWVQQMGATPSEAAQYEGFENSPAATERQESTPAFRPGEKPADEPRAASLESQVALYLRASSERFLSAAAAGAPVESLAASEVHALAQVLGDREKASQVVHETIAAVSHIMAQPDGVQSLAVARAFSRKRAQRIAQEMAA